MASLFPKGGSDSSDWRLDIVGLLAVTGESFMADHAQAITSSRLAVLPRIMPAPQALLRASRPRTLPSEEAKVIRVDSGMTFNTIGFFANIIHPVDYVPQNSLYIIEVCRPIREVTTRIQFQASIARENGLKATVPVSIFSPLNIISFSSCFLTIGLVVAGCLWKDGAAAIAVGLLSIASSVISYDGSSTSTPPGGSTAIQTPTKAILVVQCTKEIADLLYSGDGNKYRILMMTGATFIIPSVILLGNYSFNMQILCGVSYTILNIIYWGLGLFPPRYTWDLTRFTFRDVTTPELRSPTISDDSLEEMKSTTKILWCVIRETKKTDWILSSGLTPRTPQWTSWLQKVKEAAEVSEDWRVECPAVAEIDDTTQPQIDSVRNKRRGAY
ncbi:hypothetical protein K449DRAFT_423705 [Hypoxylon sp. EC38]|nr:hypothetical protein K449DRAFT_423705 [Hypoxylon sp. EC38]